MVQVEWYEQSSITSDWCRLSGVSSRHSPLTGAGWVAISRQAGHPSASGGNLAAISSQRFQRSAFNKHSLQCNRDLIIQQVIIVSLV